MTTFAPCPTRGRSMPMPRLFALWSLLAVLACSDEPPPAVEPEPALAAPTAPAQPVLEDPALTPQDVPIAEDFEEQALGEVSVSDLRAQLDAIEAEIASDSYQ